MTPASTVALALAGLLTTSGMAHAQSPAAVRPGFELLIPSGTVGPAGAARAEMKRAHLTAVQISYGLRPDLVLTSTAGWARTTPGGAGADADADLFTYDAGVECRVPRRREDGRFNVKPFAGAGIGARTRNSRDAHVATAHHPATYLSAGGEVGLWRVRVRLELRDYLTWATPAGASNRTRRHDVAVLAGLRLALR